MERVKIADLVPIQTRAETDAATVAEYAERMRDGAKFPPVTVFCDAEADTLWLADGIHRVDAAKAIGFKAVKAEVTAGTKTDALRFALLANVTHGKAANTNADKRKRLEMAWANRRELWPREDKADPSAAVLAEACGISVRTAVRFLQDVQPMTMSQVQSDGGNVSTCDNVIGSRQSTRPPVPVRRTFGLDGKVRQVTPVRNAVPVRPAAPTSPTRTPPAYDHAKGVMTDRFGVEIPMAIRDAFKAETVRDEIETHLRTAATLLKRAMDEKDPSVAQFRQADLIDLQNAVRTAKFTRPHCVCRICQGNGRGSCTACHETGFQTQAQYDNNPKEFKAGGGT
jgi:hypothetical protein